MMYSVWISFKSISENYTVRYYVYTLNTTNVFTGHLKSYIYWIRNIRPCCANYTQLRYLQNLPPPAQLCSFLFSFYVHYYILLHITRHGPGSSVGIANGLRAGRSRIESRRERDFKPVQTGPGAHPASCKMGTGSCQKFLLIF